MGRRTKIGLGFIAIELMASIVLLVNLVYCGILYGWNTPAIVSISNEFFIAMVIIMMICFPIGISLIVTDDKD